MASVVYLQAMILVVFHFLEQNCHPVGITEGDLTSIATGLKYPKFPAVRGFRRLFCGIAIPEL